MCERERERERKMEAKVGGSRHSCVSLECVAHSSELTRQAVALGMSPASHHHTRHTLTHSVASYCIDY